MNNDSVIGKLQDNYVVVEGPLAISLYNKGYYGRPEANQVVLTGFEALHLQELGRVHIEHRGQIINEAQVLAYFSTDNPRFVPRYLVYKDLRNRGYVVNIGEGSSFFFRLYSRGAVPKKDSARYYVTPLQEGHSIQLGALEELITVAAESSKSLVFGLVDAVGDVSYLKVSQKSLPLVKNKATKMNTWSWETVWEEYLSLE